MLKLSLKAQRRCSGARIWEDLPTTPRGSEAAGAEAAQQVLVPGCSLLLGAAGAPSVPSSDTRTVKDKLKHIKNFKRLFEQKSI